MRRRSATVSPVNLRATAWTIAAAIFALDRATKIWIEDRVSLWDTHSVIPGFFNIVHTKNRGAAFGMFADGDSQLRTFLLIGVSLGVLAVHFVRALASRTRRLRGDTR